MSITLHKSLAAEYKEKEISISPWTRFINWSDKQEEYRLGWTAFAITAHGCFFTIVTVLFILLAGNSMILWPFAIGSMALCLVVNLAALPTKITIPVLVLSLLIDIAIIGICIGHGLSDSALFP